MKSKIVFFFLLSFSVQSILATEQEPDILHYKGYKLKLETGWGHPTPLQAYYNQKKIDYPFQWYSTANYRGHVATWKIDGDKMYITKIRVEDESHSPMKYQIVSEDSSLMKRDKVLADWFSGVLVCNRTKKKSWNVIETFYFHIRSGRVVGTVVVNASDSKRIQEITERDTSNVELMKKYKMLLLNENYITYYFRLHAKDTIEIDGKVGFINRSREGSPVLAFFDNDHLKWPYSWENFNTSGAPNCKWTIRNDSIFLEEVGLLSSLNFYSVRKTILPLEEVFQERNLPTELFADWMKGVFIVEYGHEVEDKSLPGYKEFKPNEFVYYRISDGRVLESELVKVGFNFRDIPDGTPEHLKRLIEDF